MTPSPTASSPTPADGHGWRGGSSAAERELDASENRAFLADLAVRVGIRGAVLLPRDGSRVRVVWAAGPGDRAEVARLAAVGRAWLADAAEAAGADATPPTVGRDTDPATVVLPLRHRREAANGHGAGRAEGAGGTGGAADGVDGADGADGVAGVMVVAKSGDAPFTAAEVALVRLMTRLFSDQVDDWLHRPTPVIEIQLPAVVGAGVFGRGSELEAGMRAAPGKGELFVLFQPEVDLASSAIVALEALVRWRHPERGELVPDSFIAEAERSDLIKVVGGWVLDEALRHAAAWQGDLPDLDVVVRVNVSPVQLVDPGFAASVRAALERRGVAPDRLCIEITENSRVADIDPLRRALRELRAVGVTTAMDDFASGFSSLGRLRVLDVDAVKLDRSVVSGVDDDVRAQAIVRASAELATALGIDLVAEGIERVEEAETIARLGCRRAQGHLFGRPMTPAAAGRELAERGRRQLRDVGAHPVG